MPDWIRTFSKSEFAEWPTRALGVLAIVIGTFALWSLVRRAARRAQQRFEIQSQSAGGDPQNFITTAQRLTALQLVVNSTRYVLFAAAALLILSQLNLLKPDSLLFPAGFLGAALGLGAQNLVRDVVAGLFIVFEGQFAVGDYVKINNVSGHISEVGLRVTSLRDDAGQTHFFPNGAITTVARAARSAADLWLWLPVFDAEKQDEAIKLTRVALDDFDELFDVWHEAPRLLETPAGSRNRFALRVQPAQASLVREKLPTRVAGALEAAGLKNQTGATVELTVAPAE